MRQVIETRFPICIGNMRQFIVFGLIAVGAMACAGAPSEEQEEELTAADEALTVDKAERALRGAFAVSGPTSAGGAGVATFSDSDQFTTTIGEFGGHGKYTISRKFLGPVCLTLAYTSDMEPALPAGEYRVIVDGAKIILVNRSVTPGEGQDRPKNLYRGKRWTLSAAKPATVGKLGDACGSRGLPKCGEGTYCNYASAPMGSGLPACGRTDVAGKCAATPKSCVGPNGFDPDARVCGCDGLVYLNACRAGQAGISVDYAFMLAPGQTPPALAEACP